MRVLVTAAILALSTRAGGAELQPAERGPILSLRAGYGVPSGDALRGGPGVAELAERKFPLAFELGYRINRRLWAQLAFEVAPATPAASLCAGGTSCSASDVHLGAQLVVRLLPGARVDPWLSAGAGVEVLSATGREGVGGAALRTQRTWAGVELPYLEAGADVALSRWIGVGPWASVSFVRYTSDSSKPDGGEAVSGGIRGQALHRWVAAGMQATLRL